MLRDYISITFADYTKLSVMDILEDNSTLADIIEKSELLHNSIDLMEAFAKTANSLKKEHGIQVRLPALALDTPMTEVLKIFMEEAQQSSSVS